jgi:hypothetical protein
VAELLHDTKGIFAQGVPLVKGLNDACDRLTGAGEQGPEESGANNLR